MSDKTELQTDVGAAEGLSSTEGAMLQQLVMCHDCGCDATKDRYDNGDNKIRCGECSLKRYKKDHPFEILRPMSGILNFRVTT